MELLHVLILIQCVILMCYSQIRNHLIHRYFEDPLQLLSNIKDDDRLAAYKVPKIDKNTKYLQLIHRRREQYVIFKFTWYAQLLYLPKNWIYFVMLVHIMMLLFLFVITFSSITIMGIWENSLSCLIANYNAVFSNVDLIWIASVRSRSIKI